MKTLCAMLQGIVMVMVLGVSSNVFAASEPLIGEIMMFGGTFCPRGWANLDGQLLPVNQNQALFSLLGTTYGGDGRTTFALPDLRGRMPLHVGQGAGLTNRRQGEKGGTETHTLTIAEMPQHQHPMNASKGGGTQASPTGNLLANQSRKSRIYAPASPDPLTPMHATTVGASGGNWAHNNMQPFMGIRFCIALQGIYPTRQ